MKVIGIDASRANTTERTGTEWYIFNLIQQLKQLIPTDQYKVILYTKEPLLDDLLPLPTNWINQVLHWPPQLLWTQLRMSFTMLRPSKRPDLLFIPAHTIPIIHPRNSVYVAHDLGFERIPELYSNAYIGGRLMNALVRIGTLGHYSTNELDYHRWSMRFAVKHAKKIIAISEFTRSELMSLYNASSGMVTVIHNGMSNTDYTPLPSVPLPEQPYILYVGRIEHKKNILKLVEAFSECKQRFHIPHQLMLVGSPGYGYEEIAQTIKQHNLESDVIQPGYVPQAKMNLLMNQASAFVFPSQYEGFGIPVLEALSAGIPVACSDIPPLREIGGNACWYFDQRNSVAMAETIVSALRASHDERERKQQIGFETVKQFTWERCALQTWQVLQTIVD